MDAKKTAAEQALIDIELNLEVCRERLEKIRAKPHTHESHLHHGEGMVNGLEVAVERLRARMKSTPT